MGKKILIVDDELPILEMLKDQFVELGHQVLAFNNPKEALEKVDFHQIDCIISDIVMPNIDGVQFISRVYEMEHRPAVFFITGYSDYPREKLNELRPKAVIFKPFDFNELIEVVLTYLK